MNNFKRNKPAVAGLAVIILIVLIAVAGYLVMPDQTPQSNDMLLQLSIKKPGSVFTLLRVRKEETVPQNNLFIKMLNGQPDQYRSIPIVDYRFLKDSIIVNQYIGAEDKPERAAFNIYEVVTGKKAIIAGDEIILWDNVTKRPHNEALRKRFRDRIIGGQIIKQKYWLGTDLYGRDLLSRVILGARISLAVGLVSVIISMFLGVIIGAVAGYFGGWIDGVLGWVMNVLWALPALLLVIAISFALGKGLWQIFIAIGISMWVDVARLVRGQVIATKRFEFVEAARALGFTHIRIIGRHILPNIIGPVLVLISSNFASAILLEAGLSFLGFGAQPPTPTWGGMIKEHYGYIIMDAAYLAMIPGLAIMITVYAFNLVTLGLRDAFDIKSENARM